MAEQGATRTVLLVGAWREIQDWLRRRDCPSSWRTGGSPCNGWRIVILTHWSDGERTRGISGEVRYVLLYSWKQALGLGGRDFWERVRVLGARELREVECPEQPPSPSRKP